LYIDRGSKKKKGYLILALLAARRSLIMGAKKRKARGI
jgi:hypothetical protein